VGQADGDAEGPEGGMQRRKDRPTTPQPSSWLGARLHATRSARPPSSLNAKLVPRGRPADSGCTLPKLPDWFVYRPIERDWSSESRSTAWPLDRANNIIGAGLSIDNMVSSNVETGLSGEIDYA
jgi:hypothetical protein